MSKIKWKPQTEIDEEKQIPTEYEALRSEIDFGRMVRETQQSEIDYLKLMGGM